MWKLPFAFLLALFSQLALALPTPKDIDAAVKARQFSQAEAMLHEVIQARPQSAKAYYELGQVLIMEGRRGEARQALMESGKLEPDLKFAKSPEHFRELLNRVENGPVSAAQHAGGFTSSPAGAPFPWSYLLIGGGVLLGLWLLVRRSGMASNATSLAPAGYAPSSGYGNPPGYGAVPPGSGSGVGGAVLGGLAGMAAGYGLAKVLEHEGGTQAAPAASPAMFDAPGQPQPDYIDYDPGNGDGWDASDTAMGGDDW
ncbi:MAG: tetratricopeptide repeat protein [Gallionellaceae bacterium]|nr:tetratricopeptide repeat protein [Gallionellaceae bacterium]